MDYESYTLKGGEMERHKVFISYHHANDQWAKEELIEMNKTHNLFIDMSVDTGDIDENLPPETIRTKIRDEYLKDTTVLIVLVGKETKNRKHIDWEIYSSMYNGSVNKQSGILVITLPESEMTTIHTTHGEEEKKLYSGISWFSLDGKYDDKYGNMPKRILDNIKNPNAKISVVPWNLVKNDPDKLRSLIDLAFNYRANNDYDLSDEMMKRNK